MKFVKLNNAVLYVACALTVWLWNEEVNAQIVNVAPTLEISRPEGISGEAVQSFSWRTGNTESLQLQFEVGAFLRRNRSNLMFKMSGRYESAGGASFDSRIMEHLRYRFDFCEWLGQEFYVQHEYNQFRRLRLRVLAGTGPRIKLVARRFFSATVGTAWMFEYVRLDFAKNDDGSFTDDSGDTEVNHRWSSYLMLNLAVSGRVQVVEITYVQPCFNEMSDFRLFSEIGFVFKLVGALSFKIGGSISYDAHPPAQVKRLDTTVSNSLSFSFGPFR